MNGTLKLGVVCIAGLRLFAAWTATTAYRLNTTYHHNLPMTFAHSDHAEQQCVKCHHNYIDDTGQGLCMICHQTDPKISYQMRDQFHGLCSGCHNNDSERGEASGPLRSCIACHSIDDMP
jgi:uncharacterized membrane protein